MSWFGKKKQKQKQYSGFPGDCSEEQLKALQNFKKHVQLNNKVPIENFDDIYLLRFLRARKFDLVKTAKMWDNFIDWRVKNNIDNFQKFKFPELVELRKLYPHGYHKVDKQFRPVYIERVGSMEVDKIFKVMQTENMLQYYAVLYQTLLTTIFDGCTKAREFATGQHNRVTQTVTILDLKHVKLGNASKAYDFVKPVSAMAQDNYPEILGNMFIINAPMLFTGIWAIVKMWIDDKTKEKIKILGGSYKKELLQLIEPENLPSFLQGGKCTCGGKQCKLDANVGPWNPQGKQMFEQNIDLHYQQKHQVHKEFHKEQVLLSSPDVLVEVEVKDELPSSLSPSVQIQQQEKLVLQKVKQIDQNQNEPKVQSVVETEGTQTQQIKQQVKQAQVKESKTESVQQGTQTQQNIQMMKQQELLQVVLPQQILLKQILPQQALPQQILPQQALPQQPSRQQKQSEQVHKESEQTKQVTEEVKPEQKTEQKADTITQ